MECLIKDYDITIAGELTSRHKPDCHQIVSEVLTRIGLPNVSRYRLHIHISRQSPDIALGVDGNDGAGDQGMMFGYATDETPEMLPIPYAVATYALQLLRDCGSVRLLPDAKAQVSYDYDTKRITTFLISTQHDESCTVEDIRPLVESIMELAALHYHLNTDFLRLVNPTGRFVVGSSFADAGLTGRMIIADTYQKDDQYAKAMEQLVEAEEQLSQKLDNAGKEHLKRFQECQAEVNFIDNFYAFQTGFQLGVRLMLDVLSAE